MTVVHNKSKKLTVVWRGCSAAVSEEWAWAGQVNLMTILSSCLVPLVAVVPESQKCLNCAAAFLRLRSRRGPAGTALLLGCFMSCWMRFLFSASSQKVLFLFQIFLLDPTVHFKKAYNCGVYCNLFPVWDSASLP